MQLLHNTGYIILTGAAGLIGSNLLAALNKAGYNNIIIVDNLNHAAKNENLKHKKYVQYYHKNIFLQVLPTLTHITAIIHQGACSSTTEADVAYLNTNNVDYSKALLHYAIQHSIPYIYASSAAVYGNGTLGFSDASNAYLPINGYAHSKLEFDKYVSTLLPTTTAPIIGFRYFNVYGHGEAHKLSMSSVVYKFYESYLHNKTIQLFQGSDAILRDFVIVHDVVTVNMHALLHQLPSGIYNVGTGHAESFVAVANAFAQHYKDAVIEYIPFPTILKNKYQYYTQANISKLTAAGYTQPFSNVASGVAHYLTQLQHN